MLYIDKIYNKHVYFCVCIYTYTFWGVGMSLHTAGSITLAVEMGRKAYFQKIFEGDNTMKTN